MTKTTSNGYGKNLAFEIGRRIQEAREAADGEHTSKISQKELAEKVKQKFPNLKISGRQIGNIERGERLVRVDELIAIANVLDIPEQELLTGTSTDQAKFHRLTGLDRAVIAYLGQTYKQRPEFIRMINLIFGTPQIADGLIRALLLYANSPMLRICPLMERDALKFISISRENGNELMRQMVLEKLSKLLEIIQKNWNKLLFANIDKRWRKISKRIRTKDAKLVERFRYKWEEIERKQLEYPVVDISVESKELDSSFKLLKDKIQKELQEEWLEVLERLFKDYDNDRKGAEEGGKGSETG